MKRMLELTMAMFGGAALCAVLALPSKAQQLTPESYLTNVNIDVMPIAELNIIGGSLLYLKVPPPGSTAPSNGVKFNVMGNASATLTAEPDDFLDVADEGTIGKAVLNGEEIGYKIQLRFPRVGVPGSPLQIAGLPGFEGPTSPPLTVDLMDTGGQRQGEIQMESHPNWTPSGGIPLPGVYVGEVVLTLTAD